MSIANYASGNVKVFPSTYRKLYPQGKYTSENNFVNILNSLTDIDSYVISADNDTLKVVIHGYYFEISNFKGNDNNWINIWLGICIESGNNALVNYSTQKVADLTQITEDEKESLYTLDDDNGFTGLIWSDGKPTSNSNNYYTYYFLQVSDEKGNIINKVKLTTDSIKTNHKNDLTTELDRKQYLLKAGQGIAKITNNQDNENEVGLNTTEYNKLSNLPNKGGSSTSSKLFYFNEDGIAVNNDKLNVGSRGSGTSKIESQGVYILDGTITAGQTFYASTDNPSGGNKGDIWFKYNN
jgi:hypothetical protein